MSDLLKKKIQVREEPHKVLVVVCVPDGRTSLGYLLVGAVGPGRTVAGTVGEGGREEKKINVSLRVY